MRVLYVDDDRISVVFFVEACRKAGVLDVETAGSGTEALELVPGCLPDLLVIDLYLPDTNGYELLPALRQRLGSHPARAILCTAEATAAVEQPARAAGFDACWTKPVLPDRIAAELSLRGGADPSAVP